LYIQQLYASITPKNKPEKKEAWNMKKVKSCCLIAGLALVMLPVTAFAREAFIANVNIGLTVTSTVPALVEKDADGKTVKPRNPVFGNKWTTPKGNFFEVGSKMQKSRVSNREILQWLVNEGVIDAVKGHKIATVGERLVVVLPNGEIVFIDRYIGFQCIGSMMSGPAADPGASGAVVFEEKLKVKETLSSLGYAGSYKEKCNALAWLDVDNKTAQGFGILSRSMNESIKETAGTRADSPAGNGSSKFRFNGGTLNTISGWFEDANVECDDFLAGIDCGGRGCRSLVEGRIKVGRGRSVGMLAD